MSDTKIPHYSILIQWSDEDDAYLVSLPEWRDQLIGFAGHGSTYEEALVAGQITLEHLVSIALEDGRSLPEPDKPSVAGYLDDRIDAAQPVTSTDMRFIVTLVKDLDVGGYNVSVPALPGCFAQGDTVEESLERAKDVIGTYLDGETTESLRAAGVDPELIVDVVDVEIALGA